MTTFFCIIISLFLGFVVGGACCMEIWQKATMRGRYELMGKIWCVEEVRS